MFRPLFRENKTGKQVIGNNKPEIVCGYQYQFSGNIWRLEHNVGSDNFILEVINANGEIIKFYNLSSITENEFTLSFGQNISGKLNVLFYKESKTCALPIQ